MTMKKEMRICQLLIAIAMLMLEFGDAAHNYNSFHVVLERHMIKI